jgi:hypothetical protein
VYRERLMTDLPRAAGTENQQWVVTQEDQSVGAGTSPPT